MDIKELKIKAFQELLNNNTVTKEELKAIILDNITRGKVTEEDVKGILEQIEPVIE